MCKPIIKKIQAKNILSKTNLPVGDYAVNPYVGCTHACKYCYASFMKKFTGHLENWGEFLDVKFSVIKILTLMKWAGRTILLFS